MTNDLTLEDELLAVLPARLRCRVAYVYPRVYWKDIEVAFFTDNDTPDTIYITIPSEHWLDDWALAKICLEAP